MVELEQNVREKSDALPLSGIKVVDFGQYVAGPYCAAILGAFGADVVRVEPVTGGADRTLVPLSKDQSGDGALYRQMNQGKRSVALSIADQQARPVVDKILNWADIVVANLPPKALKHFGLSATQVGAANPKAILVTCSAFEPVGPRADLVGFDGIGQALSGAMAMTGEDGIPRKAYVHYVDFCTAAISACGAAMALIQRGKTGGGDHVSGSLLRTAMSMMNTTLMEEAVLAPGRKGEANRAQQAAPADVFQTADGWVLFQAVGDAMFARWAHLIGHPSLIDDPRFQTDFDRGEHRDFLCGLMQAWCKERTAEACVAALAGARLPAAEVLSPNSALRDPAFDMQGWFAETPVGDGCVAPVATPPVSLGSAPSTPPRSAPPLGADTRAFLDEVGCSSDEVDRLIKTGAALCSAAH